MLVESSSFKPKSSKNPSGKLALKLDPSGMLEAISSNTFIIHANPVLDKSNCKLILPKS